MRIVILLSFLGVLPAAERGLRPRLSAEDYFAHVAAKDGVTLAATVLSPDETQRRFSTDIYRGYVVVEVAVYPAAGAGVEVSHDDYILRLAGTKLTARAADPQVISAVLQKTAPARREVTVFPTVGVGYSTGPCYDQTTGRRCGGGVHTSTGVGVGVGDTRPASTDADRKTMELELAEQTLPEGKTDSPVAGYLYFPLSVKYDKKKPPSFALDWHGGATRLTLQLRYSQ